MREVDEAAPSWKLSAGAGVTTADFDLHGVVGLRLVDASPHDVATVRRQIGPLDQALTREPDITVRFVDQVTTGPLTYVGLREAGFNADGFFLLRGKDGIAAKAIVPFDQIGQGPQILCERAMPAVPHLVAIINLTALTKGVLPLHASAFTIGDIGVLVTGWAKAGKTESLLAGMSRGARYIGDEWVYLTDDGAMFGLPEPIRLWSWHLKQLPDLLAKRPRRDRIRLSVWHRSAASAAFASGLLPGASLLRKSQPILSRQSYLQVPPEELFGAAAMDLKGHLDVVVLAANHESSRIVIEPTTPAEVASRMTASLAAERAQLMGDYVQSRFAWPDRISHVIETASQIEAQLLARRLNGRPTVKVLHPYPCDLAQLGSTVLSAVERTRCLGG